MSEKKKSVLGAVVSATNAPQVGDILEHINFPGTLVKIVPGLWFDGVDVQAVCINDPYNRLDLHNKRYTLISSFWKPYISFKQQLKELL